MSLDTTPLPYGMRDIKITPYTDAAGSVLAASSIDLPNSRVLTFSDAEEFQELRGDDRVVAVHGNGAKVDWSLESGGLPFEAFKAMSGGTIIESGVSPNQIKTYTKKATDQRPYFKVEGQIISDSGGDIHVVLHRCKATGELSGDFKDGEFFLTSAKGQALAVPNGPTTDEIYRFIYNETVTNIPGIGTRPQISTITPDSQGANATVTITGTGLTGATGVTFNGVAGTAIIVTNDMVMTVKLPAGSAGSVPVVVTGPGGSSSPYMYTRIV